MSKININQNLKICHLRLKEIVLNVLYHIKRHLDQNNFIHKQNGSPYYAYIHILGVFKGKVIKCPKNKTD